MGGMSDEHPLRKWREHASPEGGKVTLEKLALELDVTPSHLSQIETGLRRPSLQLAVRLSEMTRIPVEEFVRAAA